MKKYDKKEIPNEIEISDYKYYLEENRIENEKLSAIMPKVNELTLAERTILYIYAEFGTYAKLSRYLKVSEGSARNYIKEIRKKLLKK